MTDVCVGINQGQINQLLAQVYQKTHDQLFKGHGLPLDFDSTEVVLDFDITAPPVVELTSSVDATLVGAALVEAAAQHPEVKGAGVPVAPEAHAEHIATLLAGAPGLTITIDPMVITFSSGPESAPMQVTAVTQALITSAQGKIGFQVIGTKVQSSGPPFQQWLTTHFIQPKISQIIAQALGGASFAIPAIPGVPLSPFVVGVVEGSLIAVANIGGRLPPVPTQAVPGQGAPFFVALDNAALQAATQTAIGRGVALNGGDSSGGSVFGVHYNYSFSAVNPQVQVQGNQIAATFSLSGSAGAGANIFWVPVGIGVDIGASPNPTLIANVIPHGSSVSVVSAQALDFNLSVNLSGPVGKLLGWMVDWLLSSIANALKPQILGYLRGINFATLNIPVITQPIGNSSITITPNLTSVSGGPGMIILNGALAAS